jgi:hypothetical protein
MWFLLPIAHGVILKALASSSDPNVGIVLLGVFVAPFLIFADVKGPAMTYWFVITVLTIVLLSVLGVGG